MRGRTVGLAGLAAVGAVVLVRRSRRTSVQGAGRRREARSRWQSVTILGSPDEVMPAGRAPDALAALGDDVEVEVRTAPGDRGAELRARTRDAGRSSTVPREAARRVRVALRRTKQVFEAGEVLKVDPTPHGRRPATPTGVLVEKSTERADEEGLL